ncbi:MAG: ATP-binding protein [Planctomycetes bacterium]|nr:ATP-binding protein [Planctomycetota bacterium]
MQIAVASGKGGTGKTTVATNLAAIAAASGRTVQLIDCDVEAPNAHLFLRPEIESKSPVCVPVPTIDEEKCIHCGECGRICRFRAIVSLKNQTLVFPELCHSCGACSLVCKSGAIREEPREIGMLLKGRSGRAAFIGGRLQIGEARSPPLIQAIKKHGQKEGLVIIDAPPGTSCPVIEAVHQSDYVVLVTEPTPFGLSDLKLAVETMVKLGLPFGIVVNRAAENRDLIRDYTVEEGLDLIAEIPDDLRVAEAYARGEMAVNAVPSFEKIFSDLLHELELRISKAGPLTRIFHTLRDEEP